MVVLLGILTIILSVALSYFMIAGAFALICWAFGLAFSWKVVWGIYGIILLLKWAVTATTSSD